MSTSKDLRNARKNLIGGAILLPLAIAIQIYGLVAKGQVSLWWIGIAVLCVVWMLRSHWLLKAAKAGQPSVSAITVPPPPPPARW